MAYAILRLAKLKTPGEVAAVGAHNARARETPNADPRRAAVQLVGSQDVMADVQRRIDATKAKTRSDNVIACEVFLGASPEYFRPDGGEAGTWRRDRLEPWKAKAMEYLKAEWGEANVVHAHLHLDEATPHIQAIVVPVDPETSRLNAKRWTGGKARLSAMQDRYGEAMAELGLERGVKGSAATHTDVRSWYGQMQAPTPEVPPPVLPTPPMLGRERWAADQSKQIAEAQAPAIDQLETQARAYREEAKKRQEYERTAQRQAKRITDLERQLADRDQQLARERKLADIIRKGYPLEEAAKLFEPTELEEKGITVQRDRDGRDRVYQGGKVVGRNAIDLVIQATGLSPREAVGWLADRGDPNIAADAAMHAFAQEARSAAAAESRLVADEGSSAVPERVVERVLTESATRKRPPDLTQRILRRHRIEVQPMPAEWRPRIPGAKPVWTHWLFDVRRKQPLLFGQKQGVIGAVGSFISALQIFWAVERERREREAIAQQQSRGMRR